MKIEVAVALLINDGKWLLQLRDERPEIIAPGCWGLFGGHLEEKETPEQAVKRELLEEISWYPKKIDHCFNYETETHSISVFRGMLNVPLTQLKLREGQDFKLATKKEINSGKIWSEKLCQFREIAPILKKLINKDLGRVRS